MKKWIILVFLSCLIFSLTACSAQVNEADIATKDNIKVEEVDFAKNKYGISNVPGLVINGKKISEGKVLTVREIKKLLLA